MNTPVGEHASFVRSWFAVYTATNHEKKVEQYLRMKEIEAFLPTYTVTRRWRNRTSPRLQLPLFPGYIFAKFARTEAIRVLEIPIVYSIVGNRREMLPVPEADIDALRSGLHLRQVDPYPYLKVGTRARIRSGALAGMEGVLVRKDGNLRVVLSIDLIRNSFAVHVNADEVEMVSGFSPANAETDLSHTCNQFPAANGLRCR